MTLIDVEGELGVLDARPGNVIVLMLTEPVRGYDLVSFHEMREELHDFGYSFVILTVGEQLGALDDTELQRMGLMRIRGE